MARGQLLTLSVLLSVPVWVAAARADDWPLPGAISFESSGGHFVAEVFPPKSRHNPAERPVCFFYESAQPGGGSSTRLAWRGPLANYEMPYEGVVSTNGWLVTLDEWANLGFDNSIAIYRPDGILVRTPRLDDLVRAADTSRFDHTISSRAWRAGARYFFVTTTNRFYVALPWGKAVEVSLADGAHRYADTTIFPDLAALLKLAGSNEEAHVTKTSLALTSLTDRQTDTSTLVRTIPATTAPPPAAGDHHRSPRASCGRCTTHASMTLVDPWFAYGTLALLVVRRYTRRSFVRRRRPPSNEHIS